MCRSGHVDMDPVAFEVKTKMTLDEQPAAGTLRVASIGNRVLHISYGRRELFEMQLRGVWQRKDEVTT